MNESDIESTSGLEKIAHVSYEGYFRYIGNESLVEGKNTVDHNHTFFVRLARDTQFQNIEGFPIDSIYEKNILEHNMETERFMEWCREHNIPTPKNSDGTVTQAGKEYNEGTLKILIVRKTHMNNGHAHATSIQQKAL